MAGCARGGACHESNTCILLLIIGGLLRSRPCRTHVVNCQSEAKQRWHRSTAGTKSQHWSRAGTCTSTCTCPCTCAGCHRTQLRGDGGRAMGCSLPAQERSVVRFVRLALRRAWQHGYSSFFHAFPLATRSMRGGWNSGTETEGLPALALVGLGLGRVRVGASSLASSSCTTSRPMKR